LVAAPTKWQNPYRPAKRSPEANAQAVESYRLHLAKHPELDPRELVGRDLACWCPPGLPCHADVLLELANQSEKRKRAVSLDSAHERAVSERQPNARRQRDPNVAATGGVPMPPPQRGQRERKALRRQDGRSKSVRTVSGGLPTLGKKQR
jgi:Domain of unknown function (DUF4326)